jgi:hypothetical protein
MRSTILIFATAIVLAGCSMMPAFVGGGDKPTAEAAPPAKTVELVAPASQVYEIQHLVRGPVRRVTADVGNTTAAIPVGRVTLTS